MAPAAPARYRLPMRPPTSTLVLHLPYQSPWEWRQFHQHFALRLLAGVESLGDDHYA
ncbi:hypothetical protein K3W89_14930, partial [Listeria monocytogenes]|nr:hypothetical protein [Listeria monocytogenes]